MAQLARTESPLLLLDVLLFSILTDMLTPKSREHDDVIVFFCIGIFLIQLYSKEIYFVPEEVLNVHKNV